MPFSHHSHSGQFCHHAKNSLEEMVLRAIEMQMTTFALTEHMPRDQVDDLYPEEIEEKQTPEFLKAQFHDFYQEACHLRDKYGSTIKILLGFESEWTRPTAGSLIERLIEEYHFDFFIGSVHHVGGIPIDFDRAMYERARTVAGGSDKKLFVAFFDTQYEMLQTVRPPLVGHFDLIRLKSDDPDFNFAQDDEIWSRIERNLAFIAAYGGALEINTASLRKGMTDPYPKHEICDLFNRKGGRFALSDDSHSVDQIGFGYSTIIPFLTRLNIEQLIIFKPSAASDIHTPVQVSISRTDIARHPFFASS